MPSGLELAIADGGPRLPVLLIHGHSRDPAVVNHNFAGDDTFLSDLNGQPFGAATSCDVNFQSTLMASGQITIRKADGWQTLTQVPTARPVDHAA